MARLKFMDLSVDIKTLIVQHVSMVVWGCGAGLGEVELVGRAGLISDGSKRAHQGGAMLWTRIGF